MAQTYESVAFLDREEAQEAMKILKEKGEAAVLDYLRVGHAPGEGTLISAKDNPWKEHDYVHEVDNWVMFYNLDVPYIGLVCRVEDVSSYLAGL